MNYVLILQVVLLQRKTYRESKLAMERILVASWYLLRFGVAAQSWSAEYASRVLSENYPNRDQARALTFCTYYCCLQRAKWINNFFSNIRFFDKKNKKKMPCSTEGCHKLYKPLQKRLIVFTSTWDSAISLQKAGQVWLLLDISTPII